MINPYLKRLITNNKGEFIFKNFDLKKISNLLSAKKEQYWEKAGEKMVLQLFRNASKRVPAYKKFLKKHKINARKIKTIADFKQLPLVDKENYLRIYGLDELSWDGKIESNSLMSVSSGSSGKPFFWPRATNLELETSINHGLILLNFYEINKRKTLFIDSFSMGIYIAGVVILNSALSVAEKDYPMTVITPGVEIRDTLRIVNEIGKYYDQIIIAGYPPFVKDIIDTGIQQGIKWRRFNVSFLFAAENFSEEFRNNLYQKVKSNVLKNTSINIYGSAEASIMGHETTFTKAIRVIARQNSGLYNYISGDYPYLPTLVQYNPVFKYFEDIDHELALSAYAGVPLLRYNIHDSGRIFKHDDLISEFNQHKVEWGKDVLEKSWNLPVMGIFGKSDRTISFYGLKIYPENIKSILEDKDFEKITTGRFVMAQKNKTNGDQYWEIRVELLDGASVNSEQKKSLTKKIIFNLEKRNMEYSRLKKAIGVKAVPVVIFSKKGENRYFDNKAVKQKWLD